MAFRFLLDREPNESILSRFDVAVISRYFPEFEPELPSYLGQENEKRATFSEDRPARTRQHVVEKDLKVGSRLQIEFRGNTCARASRGPYAKVAVLPPV